jgi:Putative Flp pilus-assembly TadE/G-like/von Willebrand factor type A domain
MQPSACRPGPDDRGQVLPWIAVMFVILLAIAGMVIDIGNAYRVHQQLQATADAAAAAGADNLPSTGNAVSAAATYSAAPGGKNTITGAGTVTESAYTDCSTDPVHCQGANTVHVTETANVPTTFLRLLGISSFKQTVKASACSPCGGAPLDVMIVLDRTGSMSANNKMANAKQGILAFLGSMDPAVDNVGLVLLPPAPSSTQACTDVDPYFATYNSQGQYDGSGGTFSMKNAAYVVVPLSNTYASSLGNLNNASPLVSTVNCVQPGGSTAYANALDAAYGELVQDGRPNTQKVIVMLSDGAANDAPNYLASTSPYRTNPCGQGVTSAGVAKANKVLVYSIAYTAQGDNCYAAVGAKVGGKIVKTYQTTLESPSIGANQALQQIASSGSGYFYNQPNPTSLTGIFNAISADIAQGTSRING